MKNPDARHIDALDALVAEEVRLCTELEDYYQREGFDPEAGCAMETLYRNDLTDAQRSWLSDYVRRWDDLMERQDDARRAARSAA